MMSRTEKTIVKWLTAFFYGITIFAFIGLLFWFYPRKVIKFSSIMATEKTDYRIGEKIKVSGETWTNVDAPATFDVRLVCDGVKYDYTHIDNFNVSKNVAPTRYSYSYPAIPEYVPKGECQILTKAKYEVQILPLLTRNYYTTFTSNVFEIK